MCSSLAEAHALGVVHRDLKPENIHVEPRSDGSDAVKLIDFGIVKFAHGSSIDDGHELTCAGHMIGTYEYMSPEQIVGSPCSDLSDIYSLGVVIYQMLTGHRPFPRATSPAAMVAALLTQTPAPPSLRAAIPPQLERIVMRCLAREPQDRFSNILELAGALDRLLAQHHPPHEAVAGARPAYDPGATIGDDERTWIDLETRAIPEVDRSGLTSEWERPWAMPRVDVMGSVPVARPTRRIATGTGPHQRNPPPSELPIVEPRCAPPAALYTTLPGIAVATKPRTAHDVRPVRSGPPAAHSIMPPGWLPASQARPWIPTPWIPTPAIEQLASGSAPRLPARPYGVLWALLVIGCVTAIVLGAVV